MATAVGKTFFLLIVVSLALGMGHMGVKRTRHSEGSSDKADNVKRGLIGTQRAHGENCITDGLTHTVLDLGSVRVESIWEEPGVACPTRRIGQACAEM